MDFILKFFLSPKARLDRDVRKQAEKIRNGTNIEVCLDQLLINHSKTLTYRDGLKLLLKELEYDR